MNEKEMMKQLQELRAGMKEEEANTFLVQVTNMAEVFYTSAIALSRFCNMFQRKDPWSNQNWFILGHSGRCRKATRCTC